MDKSISEDIDTNLMQINTATPVVEIVDTHEISMSKSQCYKAAKNAMEIHNLLKMVDNLESWMQAKITLAAEYLECVASNLEYDVVSATLEEGISEPIQEDHDFPYTTPQLVKLGQRLLTKIPSIKSDATANKLSALADKLVHRGSTFAEPLSPEDKALVKSIVKPKSVEAGADADWRDPSKWPHKMSEQAISKKKNLSK
jgi:hypothetical protein